MPNSLHISYILLIDETKIRKVKKRNGTMTKNMNKICAIKSNCHYYSQLEIQCSISIRYEFWLNKLQLFLAVNMIDWLVGNGSIWKFNENYGLIGMHCNRIAGHIIAKPQRLSISFTFVLPALMHTLQHLFGLNVSLHSIPFHLIRGNAFFINR